TGLDLNRSSGLAADQGLFEAGAGPGGQAFDPQQARHFPSRVRLVEKPRMIPDDLGQFGEGNIGNGTTGLFVRRTAIGQEVRDGCGRPEELAAGFQGAVEAAQVDLDPLPYAAAGAQPAVSAGDALTQDV